MFNINLRKSVLEIFADIIQNYKFIVESVNDEEVMLIKDDFSITINISLEGADITYITKDKKGNYIEYWFSNYILSKFDKKDSANYNDPQNNFDRMLSELKVIASGLKRHWENILEGDQSWINDYLETDDDDNLPPHENEITILKKYF